MPGTPTASSPATLRDTAASQDRILLFLWLAYLTFVIYGSLIPFTFRDHPLTDALQSFMAIPYLDLGVASRADWVANIALYIPLSYLLSAWIESTRKTPLGFAARSILVFSACTLVAAGIEFAQIYFPPRTVSLNDLIAETIGSAIGIVFWSVAGNRLTHLGTELRAGGTYAIRAALTLYLLGYLASSFFPYDFVVSFSELTKKLAEHRDNAALWAIPCNGTVRCAARLVTEIIAAAPLGILIAIRHGERSRGILVAALTGAVLGLVIEVGQIFLHSGISQGMSVLTRAIGTAAGWLLYQRLASSDGVGLKPFFLRPFAAVFTVTYLAFLALIHGWHSEQWMDADSALARIPGIHFLPFYYHYFSSETTALASLLRNAAMYLPIGLAYWGWDAGAPRKRRTATPAMAAVLGALIAFIVEFCKLFFRDQHPDPTDILIGAASAALAYAVASWATRQSAWAPAPAPAPAPATAEPASAAAAPPGPIGYKLLSLTLLAAALYPLAHYPIGKAWLAAALGAYALILARYPSAWLIVIPALLPVLDLSPWTGWFFLTEFDLFVLLTLAICTWRIPGSRPGHARSGLTDLPLWLLIASTLASLAIGLLPLQPLDSNAFSTYLSHYNALRVSKGLFSALALAAVFRLGGQPASAAIPRLFVPGMMLGLAGLILAILWERYIFSYFLDFSQPYRITGTFAEMNVGGPHIEAYLVFALPFAVLWAATTRNRLVHAASFLIFGLATYGLLVTFSRGGYLGFGVALAILAAGIIAPSVRRKNAPTLRPLALTAIAIFIGLAIAIPVITSGFAKARISQTSTDIGSRLSHWEASMAMIDNSWMARLFGMGLGRFPETYYLKNPTGFLPGNYRFRNENGNGFLHLGTGDSIYIGQSVPVGPAESYVLSLDIQRLSPKAGVEVFLCEKHILESRTCKSLVIAANKEHQRWTHHETTIDSERVGEGRPPFPRRPVELAFSCANPGCLVNLDNILLIDQQGANLVANGDFSNGGERWFFTTDHHWPWRVENIWLQILFEQGWFGLIAFSLLMLGICIRLWQRAAQGHFLATGLLASFGGLMAVGLFGSPLDSPKISMISFLTLFLTLIWLREPEKAEEKRRGAHPTRRP